MSANAPLARVSFGPQRPEFGSWNWIGEELSHALQGAFETSVFRKDPPPSDVLVWVKCHPLAAEARQIAHRSQIIYCPVDVYGSAAEIEADRDFLQLCSRIVVHARSLIMPCSLYARTVYLDHHLRFSPPLREKPILDGPFLWTGSRSNLAPIRAWVNENPLPGELWVLTNSSAGKLSAADYGFAGKDVRVGQWTPERHSEWAALARAAIDIKAADFRQHHKPPTKALEFLASGIPFATDQDSSSAEHLAAMGFVVAQPENLDHWLSDDYASTCIEFGRIWRPTFSRARIAQRWTTLLREVLAEKRNQTPLPRHSKVAFVTRSVHAGLSSLSAQLLDFGGCQRDIYCRVEQHQVAVADGAEYLRALTEIDADWIVSIDEGTFLLNPAAILTLIDQMDQDGVAACGMPDGGVIPIRRHNPLACNLMFNIFDMRRVRPVWDNWDQTLQTRMPPNPEKILPALAHQSPYAFDYFETHYSAFFALLRAGEKILYLDAATWNDGMSTLLSAADHHPLLIHYPFGQLWEHDPETRRRCHHILEFATRNRV